MTTTTQVTGGDLMEIAIEIYDADKSRHEMAEAAFDQASPEENRLAAIEGWRHKFAEVAHQLPRATRSGSQNASGRFKNLAKLSGQGIKACEVRLNDGSSFRIGDLTTATLRMLEVEYQARSDQSAAGVEFFKSLRNALQRKSKLAVKHLDDQDIELLHEKSGWRV